MLFKILDSLRSKPKYIRDQYALGIAVFCTLLIGGVWSLSVPSRFASESQVAALASTTGAAPFSNFFTQIKNQFGGVKAVIENLPQAPSTAPLSSASSTEAALNLKLSAENKDTMNNTSTTADGTKIQFGSGSPISSSSDPYAKPVIVATSSASSAPVRR